MSKRYTYDNYFNPHISRFTKITLSGDRRKKLATIIGNRIKMRETLKGRKLLDDEISYYKKVYMQTAGDLVVEQFLGLENVVDFNQVFDDKRISFLNNLLPTKKIDVVTFSYGLFPMVFKKTYRKTIFVCMLDKNDFYICGVGSPETINIYSNSDLVVSNYFKNNGRSAFYGFDKLTKITPDLGEFLKLI